MLTPPENWLPMFPGVRRRTLAAGERLMQMFVEFTPGAVVPEHHHPHEQISHVLRGRIRFDLGAAGETHLARSVEMTAGDSLAIPGDVPHGATALGDEGALLVETFSPPREDLLAKDVAASVNVPPTGPSDD